MTPESPAGGESPSSQNVHASPVANENDLHEAATIPPGAPLTEERERAQHSSLPPRRRTAEKPPAIKELAGYELLAEIARGGMGVVYRARQKSLNRVVALKMILAGQLATEEDVRRFHAEAEAAATLDHPHIVPVYETGMCDGQHYFSMGLVDGESLSDRIARGPIPASDAVDIAAKISEAIAYAHARDIIHRDLKPGNVLVGQDGQPRLTDFGLAKNMTRNDGATVVGEVLGTPNYMPPEQAGGQTDQIGPRSDIYSLGAILYCMLTGRPPFQAASPLDTLVQVVQQEPVPLRQLNNQIPRDLETICLKCLEKDPRRRYASAQDLADDLRRWRNDEPILARPITGWERGLKWTRRHPALAAVSFLCAAAILALFVGGIWYNRR